MSSREPLPVETGYDDAHRAVRAALSALPVLGGPAVEIFNRLLIPPIQRRRDAWLNDLADRVSKLESEGRLNADDLANDEEFASIALQASQLAIRNHQREKIDALRNAVLNTALGNTPGDVKSAMFLGFVDDFTVWHILILRKLLKHDVDTERSNKIELSVDRITDKVFIWAPSLNEHASLAWHAVDDLCRRGLVFWDRGGIVFWKGDETQVTALGREFLAFISEPPSDNR